jgi:hypothetical protein
MTFVTVILMAPLLALYLLVDLWLPLTSAYLLIGLCLHRATHSSADLVLIALLGGIGAIVALANSMMGLGSFLGLATYRWPALFVLVVAALILPKTQNRLSGLAAALLLITCAAIVPMQATPFQQRVAPLFPAIAATLYWWFMLYRLRRHAFGPRLRYLAALVCIFLVAFDLCSLPVDGRPSSGAAPWCDGGFTFLECFVGLGP